MKNIKLFSILAVVLVALFGLRFVVGQLEQDKEVSSEQSEEQRINPVQSDEALPAGEWAQANKLYAEYQKAAVEGEVGSDEWKAQVRAFGGDPEKVLMQEQANSKPIESRVSQTPEQLFPGVADLLNDKLPEDYDEVQRQQDLARFVQSVDPSVAEIEKNLAAMQKMEITKEKQQAYTAIANEKIAALRSLKEQALTLDASLMSVNVTRQD